MLLDGVDLVEGKVSLPRRNKAKKTWYTEDNDSAVMVCEQSMASQDTSSASFLHHFTVRLLVAMLISLSEALSVLLLMDSGIFFAFRIPLYISSSLPYFLTLRALIFDQLLASHKGISPFSERKDGATISTFSSSATTGTGIGMKEAIIKMLLERTKRINGRATSLAAKELSVAGSDCSDSERSLPSGGKSV